MTASSYKDTKEILELIKKAQDGNTFAENKLVIHYKPYIEYMVNKYSKKTLIKDDDDLRSYIYLGLLDGIRKFDPSKNTRFIYFAHIWMKKHIFLGEAKYRFIKVPVNQRVFYEKFTKAHEKLDDEIIYEIGNKDISNYLRISNTTTIPFSDLNILNSESDTFEFPENTLLHINKEEFQAEKKEEKNELLKKNINEALKSFSEKEIFIIESIFGLNDTKEVSIDTLASIMGISKVYINSIKTTVIKLMRHSKFYNTLFKGLG